jgi:hypothetical protein
MKKRYYNSTTKEWYNEGQSLTRRLDNGTLFSGVPSVEQLAEWGYEEVEEPEPYQPTEEDLKEQRKQEILRLLADTDYIVLKKAEGIDISEYDERYQPTFLEWRQALRDEYNELEQQNT